MTGVYKFITSWVGPCVIIAFHEVFGTLLIIVTIPYIIGLLIE